MLFSKRVFLDISRKILYRSSLYGGDRGSEAPRSEVSSSRRLNILMENSTSIPFQIHKNPIPFNRLCLLDTGRLG